MLRCALAAVAAAAFALPVAAQIEGHRAFPPEALRAELAVIQPPDVTLDGQPARLAPGARVRGDNNLLRTPASLAGQKFIVHYTRERTTGLLMDVWVLNPVELANRTWPRTEREAQTWAFDPVGQTWTRR